MAEKLNFLIIGGSEFMGKVLIERIQKKYAANIYMINRGKKYWNTFMKENKEIKFYYGDRHCYLEFQKLLTYISEKHGFDE